MRSARRPKTVARTFSVLLAILALVHVSLHAATPMNTPLKDDGFTTIDVEYDGPEKIADFPGVAKKGPYQYQVYLPAGYSKEKDRRYPCFFTASWMPTLSARAKQDKWIVVTVWHKNGPWEPLIGAFLATHDDAVKRLRIQEGMKVATGFSGGSRNCSRYMSLRPGFMGAILQSAGFPSGPRGTAPGLKPASGPEWADGPVLDGVTKWPHLAIYGIYGDWDLALGQELEDLKKTLKGKEVRCELERFPGGHGEASEDSMIRGVDWIERQMFADKRFADVAKPLVADFYKHRCEVLAAGPAPLRKYDILVLLKDVADVHGLSTVADLKDMVSKVGEQFKEVEKDPKIKDEVAARQAYLDATKEEMLVRVKMPQPWMLKDPVPPQTADALTKANDAIAKVYQAVADKYKNTEYGVEAANKIHPRSSPGP